MSFFSALTGLLSQLFSAVLGGVTSVFLILIKWIGKAVMIFLTILLMLVSTNYDAEHPDTAANRRGFRIIIGFPPGKEVTEVYFLADEWYLDCAYWLAFRAPPEVIEKIIREYDMKKTPDLHPDEMSGLAAHYHWWDQAERKKSILYRSSRKDEEGCERCVNKLWYDAKTGKAQFTTFSI